MGGTVVHEWGQERASVGIEGEVVVGLYAPGSEPQAREVVDATGLLVLPGAVDMHSHHREGTTAGFEYKEDIESVTRACAAGGVTTTVAMPNIQPPPNTVERLEALFGRYRQKAVVDWNVNPAGTVL
jgi:dihydroorotase